MIYKSSKCSLVILDIFAEPIEISFHFHMFGLIFQSKVVITPDLEVELTVITSKIPNKNFMSGRYVTKFFVPVLMDLKNFAS